MNFDFIGCCIQSQTCIFVRHGISLHIIFVKATCHATQHTTQSLGTPLVHSVTRNPLLLPILYPSLRLLFAIFDPLVVRALALY